MIVLLNCLNRIQLITCKDFILQRQKYPIHFFYELDLLKGSSFPPIDEKQLSFYQIKQKKQVYVIRWRTTRSIIFIKEILIE